MDEDERRRKLEAGRAKLASYRQKRAKGDGAGAPKKTPKRKGQNDTQNDGATQDRHVEPALPSAGDKTLNNHVHSPLHTDLQASFSIEVTKKKSQKPEKSKVPENQHQKDQAPVPEHSLSPEEDFKEELVTLTGKEQLKKLQQAVEKRNEIIARLSSNLQEALASRDQVQLEAQSLAGQIQALQRQLQQTSVEFLRIKNHAGAEVPSNHLQQLQMQGLHPNNADINHREVPSGEPAGGDSDREMDNVLLNLRAELQEEKQKHQQIYSELKDELSLLKEEKRGWEEERQEKESQLQDLQAQLSSMQTQCLELQQYKAEKEKLNAEVLDLRKRLQQEGDAQRRMREEMASSALHLQSQEEEMQKLKEEVERVRQLLEERERELVFREEEEGLKGSKNRQNQVKAGFSCDERISANEENQDGDIMMERYLSAPHAHSQSSLINESFEHCGQLDVSAENSFELNSDILGDEPLLSISNRFQEESILPNNSSPRSSPGLPPSQSLSPWLHNSTSNRLEMGDLSEQQLEETDLEKELLSQQCGELREDLALKDRDLNVLREEVLRSAEELDEARNRWAQVTDELQQALLELEEEKEKRRHIEDEMSLKTHEQDNLKNKLSALMEERENAHEQSAKLKDDNQLLTLQAHCDLLTSELQETKTMYKTTSALLDQMTLNRDETLKKLETIHPNMLQIQAEVRRLQDELEKKQSCLDSAEKEKSELESQISGLRRNLAELEEAQTQAEKEREQHRRKEEETEQRIRKIEQVLEEELEQFENILKDKDDKLAEEREKWEDEKQEKDKDVLQMKRLLEEQRREREEEVKALLGKQTMLVEQATEGLRTSHQQEIKELREKHQTEISELNSHLESELLKQQVVMEDEQKRQIGLIKQVTEREHERMISELTIKHNEELTRLRSELSVELRESLEAAHQAELQQEKVQKAAELESLRLSLTSVHKSQLEQDSALAKASLRDTFAQESAQLQAQHQLDLDHIRQQNQEQQESLRELHLQNMNELKQQWEAAAAQERDAMKEKQAEEIQALRSQWDKLLSDSQKELSDSQASLTKAQSDLQEHETSSKEQNEKLEEELRRALADRDAAARALEELVSGHKEVLQEKEQQVLHLQEQEHTLQQEVLRLQEEKTLLKQSSEEEVGQLWSQLESMRTSRQELGELKEQLLARSSRVDDIERLKLEFNNQKREIKEQNEAELESLRRYFEQRLQVAEESYREEIALLQLRLVEGAMEESILSSSFSQSQADDVAPDTSLEKQKVRSDLTDCYYDELQEIKTRHALELEQLRAKLSDHHLQELTQVRFEAARQVELEVEQRMWCHIEELQENMTIIHNLEKRVAALSVRHEAEPQQEADLNQEKEHSQEEISRLRRELQEKHEDELAALKLNHNQELEKERTSFEKSLQEEREKLCSLQAAPNNDEMRQRLQAQYEGELKEAKSRMAADMKELTRLLQEQSEERLRQAHDRFQDQKSSLEQSLCQKYQTELQQEREKLLNKHSEEMEALSAKHKAQLDSLSARHRGQTEALTVELKSKHSAELIALEETLSVKAKADLVSLESGLKETNQAQLEALEAELARKHQEERDELEKRMLGNMDTLEATYLKEVQTLRDEMTQLEERHHQDLSQQRSDQKQLMERHTTEQLSVREELRKELAQVHMEKFRAMAAELSHVHKTELAAQKEALDTEHCRALETLKKQVLELERQHSAALQEVSQTYSTEKKQLKNQHELQLQELRSVSARELEACRRELEEESSRQRQHFLEEVELLKVQSEERLQERINQVKTESEERKRVELEDLRRSFVSEQEEKERSYTGKMSQLTAQLQQLDAVVAQLRAEVSCLQGELEGKRAEMDTLDTLLQRRERETQEGGNLLKMLTDDLHTAKEERCNLDQANEKLRKVLIEMIRSTIATEELIGQKIRAKTSEQATNQRSSSVNKDAQESGIDFPSDELELTHLLCESLLVPDSHISPGGEEAALSACSRLRHTVDTLLELLNQANTQLEQTHDVHLSLEEKFSKGREDSAQLLEQHKLLMEQLDQEAKRKSQLQLELHKAEGLLEGYVAEKAVLEESLQQKETQEERLVEELEDLRVKLHQMQGLTAELESLRLKHQELSEEHALLLRQKEHLSAGLGEREKALLEETERLAQDRLDLQRQAEKDRSSLSLRLRALERELDEQETKGLETEQHHKSHTEDLHQRVQALEKQLKHDRQFIEEQAVEREHERDEFQQEIRRLEAQLRQTASVDTKGHRFEDLVLQVESLQAMIKDKTEDHASLLAANQQAQRDLTERNEEIDKLAGRIRELEQALLNSAESNRSASHLEQELHKAKLREQELTQDKQALEQQQLANRLQISALQSKLDETRHCYHDNTRDPTQELRDALDTAQQSLQSKEQEVEILLGQLEAVQSDLNIKEVELKHLTLQLELLTNQNAAHVKALQEQIDALKENVSALTILKEESEERSEVEETEEENFPSALLQEKNQEIDHLNQEIQRLEQELESTRDTKVLEAELEDLRSQVEHLQSEVVRVRENKQEEEERLHEVISTLQAELATLGPNLHEVSDSQDGDSINPSPAPSPEPRHYPVQEKRGGPSSLKQELSLTQAKSSGPLRSRLKALQSQLDTAVAEKDGLERLLLTQEDEFRGHGEEFGKRLKAERERGDELKEVLTAKEFELEELRAQIDEERSQRQTEAKEMNEKHAQLQKKEKQSASEITALKVKNQELKTETEALRESSLTLERQVQEVRAEVVDMEELVAEERAKSEELSAEREALRRREVQLQEEMERLKQEVTSMRACIQNLTLQLNERESSQEEVQKEVLTHAEVTLAKADAALRQKEAELTRLRSEHQALRTELSAVKQGLSTSTERAEKLHVEGQTKDRALIDLESDNGQLKAELRRLQEDLAVQEEELAYQQRELQQLRQICQQQQTRPHRQGYAQKDISHRAFEDSLSVSRDEASLSSPEVLRRLECSEDRLPERFHASVLGSRLSELSALNSTGLDIPHVKTSPRVEMEPPRSRTITPEPATQSTHSPGSMSDNFSMMDSVDTDKAREFEGLDLTTPPSPLGSTSSLSAPEWASDGYGSNVSSELGARLRVELEQTERLDAQFVEYLRHRGINPTVNTDSAAGSMSYSDDLLSPELQALLKKVYQESCRILTLSQRRGLSSNQPHSGDFKAFSLSQHYSTESSTPLEHLDKPSSNPPMSWQQEKRALQETVIALRELLCRMAQRQTQHSELRGEDDWYRSQLQADVQVDYQLRAELEESQKHLTCARESQQEHKNKIQSLRLAVEEGEEALRREQSRVQELQQQLEQERALSLRKEREEEERREAAHVSSEQQRSEVMALKGQVEQETVACSNLRRELQIEQSRSELLEKRLDDTQKELEEERQNAAHHQELNLQEKTRLLAEAETHLTEVHAKLADAHRRLDEERGRSSKQVDELSRRHLADEARDRKFISDLRAQLEQERRQGEELAAATEKLRAELLQSRRRWEEEDRKRREELQKEQEAATRHRVATEALREQKQEAGQALEKEREQSRRQGVELSELKERLRGLKDKEREREEQWERERRKGRQEQMERERRQERTNDKLVELELLRQQDQQRMQELQRTLAELEREEREMAAQRLTGRTAGQQRTASSSRNSAQTSSSHHSKQSPSVSSSPKILEKLLEENSELSQRVTSLSQEKMVLKHRLTCLERELQRTENELAKVATENENRPIGDVINNSKVQRLYERYLRAESFRKALVYQKRYLLLLLGGFQECEQATLCLIARMGARPSPPLSSQRKPLGRFRAAVRAVIAVSRMKFLTIKWNRNIRRLSTHVNGHASGPKAEVLKQQHLRLNSDPQSNRETLSALIPPSKSPFRLHNRSYSSSSLASGMSGETSQDHERSQTEYIHHLEKLQQRLVGVMQGSPLLQPDPKLK